MKGKIVLRLKEIPKSCKECPWLRYYDDEDGFFSYHFCPFTEITIWGMFRERPKECPIEEDTDPEPFLLKDF